MASVIYWTPLFRMFNVVKAKLVPSIINEMFDKFY